MKTTQSNSCLELQELLFVAKEGASPAQTAHLIDCALCRGAVESLELRDDLEALTLEELSLEIPTFDDFRLVKKNRVSAQVVTLRLFKYVVSAAALIALCWAGWHYQQVQSTSTFDTADSLAAVVQPEERRVRGANFKDFYQDATRAFAQKEYDEAIVLYKLGIPQATTAYQRYRGHYDLGITYWKSGRFQQAAEELTTARMSDDFFEDATWALAQLYRASGENDEAVQLYKDLINFNQGPYVKKSAEVLSAMGIYYESAQ